MPRQNHTPSHKSFVFVNNCAHKRKYPNEKQALDAAEYQMLIKQGLELSTYRCELCGHWHLTRRKQEKDSV